MDVFLLNNPKVPFFLLHRPGYYRKTRKKRSRSAIWSISWKNPLVLIGDEVDFKRFWSILVNVHYMWMRWADPSPIRISGFFQEIIDIALRDLFFRVFRYCSDLCSKKNKISDRAIKKTSAHLFRCHVYGTISVDMLSPLRDRTFRGELTENALVITICKKCSSLLNGEINWLM